MAGHSRRVMTVDTRCFNGISPFGVPTSHWIVGVLLQMWCLVLGILFEPQVIKRIR